MTNDLLTSALVIGSSSFTGAHFVDALLEAGCRVTGVSRSPQPETLFLPYQRHGEDRFAFHRIDMVTEADALRRLVDELRPAVVVQVAALSEVALSHERPVEYLQTNTVGVARLCDHLRRCDWLERYVHVSSAEIYGTCPTAIREDAPLRPSTPYAVSKAAADMYIETLIEHFDFPAMLVRSTNVYGAHQQLFKIIPRTLIYLKLGRTLELHGGGMSMKSFVHVRDVVSGALTALRKGGRGTFHFSVESDDTVRDVVALVCRKAGFDFESSTRMVGERLGQDHRYWLDCTRSREELGWSPSIAFEEGVDEVIDWVERHWSRIRELPHEYVHR